jgi:hypothetical protein
VYINSVQTIYAVPDDELIDSKHVETKVETPKALVQTKRILVRFQVLTAASMKFRIVFWDVLPCKIIVDRRFRGMCCLHHQGLVSLARKDRGYIGVQWTGLANRE